MSREKSKSLVLTRYESRGASSRIRLLQFVPAFQSLMDVRVQALFLNSYVEGIGRSSRFVQLLYGFPGLMKRIVFLCLQIVRRRKYDVVILQQELFPFAPFWIESWILRQILVGSLVIDIDDGNHIRYENGNLLTRKLCKRKFQRLWSTADLIVCGGQRLVDDVTPYLKADGRVVLIPSVPPEETSRIERRPAVTPPFVIGWIGSPSTSSDLDLVRESLLKVSENFDIEFHVVGADIEPSSKFKIVCTPWSPNAERKLLQTMHIGIMPLSATDFRERKCGFKLIQYMTVGIPVVASDVGGNRSIVIRGNDQAGYIASSVIEWVAAFRELLTNEHVRGDRGRAAARIASKEFSYASACAQWELSLRDLLEIKTIGVAR